MQRKATPANMRFLSFLGVLVAALGSSPVQAQPFAYVTHQSPGTVTVINTKDDTVVGTAIPVGPGARGVVVNPTGSTVYVAVTGAGVAVIDTVTNMLVTTIQVGIGPTDVAISPDGTRVYAVNNGGATVSVIDTATNRVIGSPIPVGFGAIGVATTPDGKKVYTANFGSFSVINTADNSVTTKGTPLSSFWGGIKATPDSKNVYMTSFGDNAFFAIDTTSDSVVSGGPTTGGPAGVAVSPDNASVYVVSCVGGGFLDVFNRVSNALVAFVPTGGSCSTGVAVTPDGKRVYVANTGTDDVSAIDTTTRGVISGTPIPIGTNPGIFSGASGVAITPSPTNAIQALIIQVGLTSLNTGQQHSLTGKLIRSLDDLIGGRPTLAINSLHAFINEVQSLQQDGKLDATTAGSLIDAAQAIANSI